MALKSKLNVGMIIIKMECETKLEKKELYKTMGERLREYRKKMNYTQEQVAELLDMSLTYYGKIERGINGLSIEKLALAHEKLDIDIAYLLTGEKKTELTFDGLLQECPREKRYEMEQLIKYAINLVK